MDQDVVRRWLKQVCSLYPNASRVYTDVDSLLLSNPSLRPSTSEYISDVGQASLLINLKGTIPILFKQHTYHIPLVIWIPRAYPREAPLVYVDPTKDMLVRKGEHVELSGKTSGPWLTAWEKKWEACNLVGMIQSLQQQFGEMPPVYARPAEQVRQGDAGSASSSRSTPQAPQARSPAALPPSASRVAVQEAEDRAPARPPRPDEYSASSLHSTDRHASPSTRYQRWSASYQPQPTGFRAGGQGGTTSQPSPIETNRPASFHAATPPPSSFSPRDAHMASVHSSAQHLASAHPSAQAGHYGEPWRERAQQTPWTSSTQRHISNGHNSNAPPAPAPPPLPPHAPDQADFAPPRATSSASASIASPAIAAAPPLPPNPELLQLRTRLQQKLHAHIAHTLQASSGRTLQLRRLLQDLERGVPAVEDEMQRLRAVRDVVRGTLQGLRGAREQTESRTKEVLERDDPNPDEVICATSIVGNQLLNLTADDNAIEDTLYHLGRALGAEQLDLDKYLKQTRFLAREQFFKRALAGRICRSMGWE